MNDTASITKTSTARNLRRPSSGVLSLSGGGCRTPDLPESRHGVLGGQQVSHYHEVGGEGRDQSVQRHRGTLHVQFGSREFPLLSQDGVERAPINDPHCLFQVDHCDAFPCRSRA